MATPFIISSNPKWWRENYTHLPFFSCLGYAWETSASYVTSQTGFPDWLDKTFHLRQIVQYNLSFSLSNNMQAPKRALAGAMVAMGTTLGTTVDG